MTFVAEPRMRVWRLGPLRWTWTCMGGNGLRHGPYPTWAETMARAETHWNRWHRRPA